ncbi:nucleolar [Halobacteriales archaeon QS_4_62_28]|nr:MAG: nucleolar [Halobacteriales archaeon QS_4_62_28]
MTDGWYAGLDPGDTAAGTTAIREGSTSAPDEWPSLAVEIGFAEDEAKYYELLHTATMAATEAAVQEQEGADDRQLVHAVRSMTDCEQTANELAERVAEWGESRSRDAGSGVEYARELAENEGEDAAGAQLQSLAQRVVDLDEEAARLRSYIERTAPAVAPNLAALAGPVLTARLLSLAGGLESLAKKPSGTVQVLGAEDALFAHLRGNAPSPKHGIIFTHEAVRGTHPEHRGSAARALAGKLSIGARIDHYSGDLRPELQAELDERIETIQARTEGEKQ